MEDRGHEDQRHGLGGFSGGLDTQTCAVPCVSFVSCMMIMTDMDVSLLGWMQVCLPGVLGFFFFSFLFQSSFLFCILFHNGIDEIFFTSPSTVSAS